jgi:dephospho-CoA kinase
MVRYKVGEKMLVVGLTGSIGTGKSTVSNVLKTKNINIIDADKISREILNNTTALNEIFDYFGDEVKNPDGTLNRKKLGNIVFNDDVKLIKLNSITHPKIKENINNKLLEYKENKEKIVIVDAPLLIEAKFYDLVDKILLIVCDEEVQINRIVKRDNCSKEDAILRIKSQMSQEDKKNYADYIIDNSYDLEILNKQVEEFLKNMEEI